MTKNESRQQQAYDVRVAAAEIARRRIHPVHIANGDEQRFRHEVDGKNVPNFIASYTKGLPHNEDTGLVNDPEHFLQFVRAIDSGDPRDFQDTPLGNKENYSWDRWLCKDFDWKSKKARTGGDNGDPVPVRAWESQGAGSTFDLEGPDAQAVTMPPAPTVGSDELTAEMGEVYVQALLRDVPFAAMSLNTTPSQANAADKKKVSDRVELLNKLDWFAGNTDLSPDEANRHRSSLASHTAFRGITPGDEIGPYISQFMLAGNAGFANENGAEEHSKAKGYVAYGAITVDQRVRFAKPEQDYLTFWSEWLDAQNGADLRGLEAYTDKPSKRRFITTPRDLATYVHYDALYEAYLNACLLLLGEGIPFDPGIPFQAPDNKDHQQGFAHFGGPHILSLVTEVATRALKAVRFQKFNIHRRLRPEALAARMEKKKSLVADAPELQKMFDDLKASGILDLVQTHNKVQNQQRGGPGEKKGTFLLPMAFCEGSPMHPSYGAGHATVAGACVTILKAFFDHKHPLAIAGDPTKAFVPTRDGSALETIDVKAPDPHARRKGSTRDAILTVEGELNKLASNISIGRDWAGVHYFTDYIESLRMGEQIALGILEEQRITYGENFSMTVPLFDGGSRRI